MFSKKYIPLFCIALFLSAQSKAQLKLDSIGKIAYLVKNVLLGEGVTVSNMKYSGSQYCIGGFKADSTELPIKKGIVLSTGRVVDVMGPNYEEGLSGFINTIGDKDLKKICGHGTYDAVVLEFDFIPTNNFISFNFFFASEEYLEYVNTVYNDVFAFIVDGEGVKQKNLAVIPFTNSTVTVNNINPTKNPGYYINNPTIKKINKNAKKTDLNQTLQFDGFTVMLTAECAVKPGKKYHIKIAIADAGDYSLDSGVFIEAGSFSSTKTSVLNQKKFPKTDVTVKKEIVDTTKKIVVVKKDSIIPPVQKPVKISNILFDTDSYSLTEESKTELNKLVEIMKKNPAYFIELYGYTDSVGNYEYNQKLSDNRAKSVSDYLISKGVKKEKISFKGLSKSKPVADNDTEKGRALNRRVEVQIKKPQ